MRVVSTAHQAGIYEQRLMFFSPAEGAAEKINNIFGGFPYWSNTVLGEFVNITGNSSRLPFDAHELVSLIAPVSTLALNQDVNNRPALAM